MPYYNVFYGKYDSIKFLKVPIEPKTQFQNQMRYEI